MKTGKKIVVLTVLVFILLPVFVQAAPSWWPLVPCGLNPPTDKAGQVLPKPWPLADSYYQPCNRCELLHLFRNIIDFTLVGLMPPVATVLFVWGGFLILMGGANPGLISKGKAIFWNTVIGIAIISASWLITNTIIRSIADDNVAPEWWKFKCSITVAGPPQPPVPQPPGPQPPPVTGALSITTSSLSDAIQSTAYSQPLYVTGGTAPYTWSLASGAIYLPAGLSVLGSTISGTPTATGTYTFTIAVQDSSSPVQSATKQLTIRVVAPTSIPPPAGTVCPYTGVDLCQPQQRPGGCSNSLCPQYVSAINQYAGGVASANLLKAIMINESSCDVTRGSGTSYGLMALSPGTVTAAYKSRCGISLATQIDQAWLTSPANASLSICLAAEYIRALGQSLCGSSIRHLAANYNGGNACAHSINCASETSCDGGKVRRWECLYDDDAHNVCNTGFDETRGYAPKVLYCYNNPGF